MAHAANEVVDTVVVGVDEGVLTIHNGHKSESRYIIKQNKSLVACAWLVSPGWRGCALSPRQNVVIWFIMLSPSPYRRHCLRRHASLPAPACTTACACSTHIPLDLFMVMSGSGGHSASPVPATSKSLHLFLLFDATSSEVSSSLSVSTETRAPIPKNRDVIKPLFRNMMSSFCILVGCQGNSDAP